MPFVSDEQRAAFHAAAAGKGKIGIPKKVAKEFISKERRERKKKRFKARLRGR